MILPALVRAEHFAAMVGRYPNTIGVVVQALQQEPNSTELCQLLNSPLGQAALNALALEFPGWGLVFQLLPLAAEAICKERNPQSNHMAVAVGAVALGVGLILVALSNREAA